MVNLIRKVGLSFSFLAKAIERPMRRRLPQQVSFDVVISGAAGSASATAASSPICSVLGHSPRSLIGPCVSRIFAVLQITLQTTPRATAALLPPCSVACYQGAPWHTQKQVQRIFFCKYNSLDWATFCMCFPWIAKTWAACYLGHVWHTAPGNAMAV